MPQGFQLGECYSRTFISRELGGGIRNFLPHKGNAVVCGCFTRKKNPDAPQEILPGDSDDRVRWARQFSNQEYPVPVFIKEQRNSWRYMGMWRVQEKTEKSERPEEIARANVRAHRTDIAMILRLVEVEGP